MDLVDKMDRVDLIDHAKNFSFIYQNEKWQVSSDYDLVCSSGFNGQHTTTVLGKCNLQKEDMCSLAKEIGLSKKYMKIFMMKFMKRQKKLEN
jgi:serine/threonine-protein kinase HipA